MSKDKSVNDRALNLLRVLIERYIRDGQPVASKTLAADEHLPMSPATIRNIMSDLEAEGYLHSPHTSAGRVPTDKAYRFFVDALLVSNASRAESFGTFKQQVQSHFSNDIGEKQLLERTSNLLSGITQMAGLVTLPKRERLLLSQVEFLSLAKNRVLVVLVLNGREVQNRIIHTERVYSRSELEQAGNYLTEEFSGKDLANIHIELVDLLKQQREQMNSMMQSAINLAEQSFAENSEDNDDVVVAGQGNLLGIAEATGVDRLRSLFNEFTAKRNILHLFDECLKSEGLQIFIGKESGLDVFDDFSLVTAPYSVGGEVIGALGVIGPTRMPYDNVIPMVDVTARLLSAALSDND